MKKMNGKYFTYEDDIKEKKKSIPFKITLAGLFPTDILKEMICSFIERSPDMEIKEGDNNQHILIRTLLPAEYRKTKKTPDIADFPAARVNLFFTYYKPTCQDKNTRKYYRVTKSTCHSWYTSITDCIFRNAKKTEIHYKDFNLVNSIKSNLETMFNGFSDAFKEDYESDISELIDNFKQHPLLNDFRHSIKNEDFYSRLSILVLLALTWSSWDTYNTAIAEDLAHIILPVPQYRQDNPTTDTEWRNAFIQQKAEEASSLFKKCKNAFKNAHYEECADTALEIVKNNFAEEAILGEVYYLLALCYLDHNYTKELIYANETKKRDRADKYGKELMSIAAFEYGNNEALIWLRTRRKNNDFFGLLSPIGKTSGTARIYLNTTNKYTSSFLMSLPEEMKNKQTLKENVMSASGKKQLAASIDAAKDTRYLFFDESPEKNFQDLLYLLDGIANTEIQIAETTLSLTEHWSKTTVYIRVPEDQYAALIDTALKRLGSFTIKVHIIDDEKWTAQYLLFNHPLFDGIKNIENNRLTQGPVIINFTIIGNGNHKLTTRLIREAYWMGCFAYAGITLHINVISPDTLSIKSELHLDYPGMFAKIPDSDHVSSVSLFETDCYVPSMSDLSVRGKFDTIEDTDNAFNYYVVNTEDDIQNLNFAIKLREWTIQNKLSEQKSLTSKSFSTIAFYCSNSDIAYLSQNMVVQTVDHGNRWFNNYNIKPFGMLRERYSWDAIDGGYLEKVAESTHLQYSGIDTTASNEEKNIALVDYFSRSYNRDSSMAVSLSLPYRLFHLSYKNGNRIIPHIVTDNLNIHKDNEAVMNLLAEQFRNAYIRNSHRENLQTMLLYYEHSRWLRWAYSRGWKKASPEDVVAYMNAGNPKQQLFIARLHGCLCAVEDLNILSNRMKKELDPDENGNIAHKKDWDRFAADRKPIPIDTGSEDREHIDDYNYTPKDFTKIDKSNIDATADILQTRWFDHKHIERSTELEK